MLSGRHCLIELAEAPRAGRAQYLVAGPDGQTRPAGRLNFMPPASTRAAYCSEGTLHTTLCVMESDRLGLLGSIDWCWDDVSY